MKIKLKKSEQLNDWYSIVRSEHDGKEWLENVSANICRLMLSERLSPEASIEGSAFEMIEVAKAIKNKESVYFRRIAVHFINENECYFYSPRNSQNETYGTIISFEDANELADQILGRI